jgi:membrane protease YdiL (CAAX protease family)
MTASQGSRVRAAEAMDGSSTQVTGGASPDAWPSAPAPLATGGGVARREGVVFLVYYVLFMAYMTLRQEGELLHWASLVAVPFALIVALRARSPRHGLGLADALASVGLRRGDLRRGLGMATLVGLALSVLQVLLLSDRKAQIWQIIVSGKVLMYLPLIIVLLFVTAGFTEEFFFRGVLQTRLRDWWGVIPALVVTSLLFGLYHFPYIYLMQGSQLRGHVWGSLGECGYDAVGGLILGLVYLRSRQNLLAAVTTHVLIDTLPAMTMIHFTVRLGG